jgi:endonuclease YncB( thermonuclease family)
MEYTIKEYMTSYQLLELHNQGYTSFILPMELYNKTFSAHDADTISLKGETDKRASGSFRFIGIDAPELHQKNSLTGEPIGKIALGRFNEIVSGAQYLKIEVNGVDNKGKRLMGTVYDDKGQDINLLLLKEGYVQFYDRYKESIPHSSLAMYEQAALASKSKGKLAYSPGVEQPEIWRQKTQGKDIENEVSVPQTPEPSYSKELPTFEDVYGDLYDSETISQEDRKNSLAYLSRLYGHYYSSVDCKVFLVNNVDGKSVQVDLIQGY